MLKSHYSRFHILVHLIQSAFLSIFFLKRKSVEFPSCSSQGSQHSQNLNENIIFLLLTKLRLKSSNSTANSTNSFEKDKRETLGFALCKYIYQLNIFI